MTTAMMRGRDSEIGGYDKFHDRSRSRGDLIEHRGERYGRSSATAPLDLKSENVRGIRGDKTEGGPD